MFKRIIAEGEKAGESLPKLIEALEKRKDEIAEIRIVNHLKDITDCRDPFVKWRSHELSGTTITIELGEKEE